MPSYAYDVKNELAHIFDERPECKRAELAALLKVGAVAADGRIDFANSNAAVARKVFSLAKFLFPGARMEVAAVRTKKLRKTMRYYVRIFFTPETKDFLDNLDVSSLVRRSSAVVAYLRGAFLAGGTVNRPESYYRAEIVAATREIAEHLRKLLRRSGCVAAIYERKDELVVYMNEGDNVCDFLAMLGAENAVERFEIARNLKEVRTLANRLVNCETANLYRAIDVAQRQLADIRVLLKNNVPVKENLREAMRIRLENPECSVGELGEKIFLSRPALMSRFKKIHLLAEKFGGGER